MIARFNHFQRKHKKDIETLESSIERVDVEEVIKQVEVSHGSTSNQTAMYELSDSSQHGGSFSFCLDTVIIIILLAICLFVMLFWYDHIPGIDTYFQHHQHHEEKKIIVILSVVLIVGLFILLLLRWIKRSKCTCCHRNIKSILSRNRLKDSYDSGIMSDDIYEPNLSFNSKHISNSNLKLNELTEDQLIDLRRIMQIFLNYHEDNDWILTPSSSPTSYNLLGTSPISQLTNIKIKFTVKLVLVGSPNVGKTSVFHRILYNSFTEYYMATLGADVGLTTFHIFPKELNNHVMINLQLWDIAGSESFTDLARIVYKDSTALLLVCDVSNSEVIPTALPWIQDIEKLIFDPYVALLCNKIDVATDERTSYERMNHKDLNKFDLYDLSAKTGEHVVENVVKIICKSVLHEVDKLL